MLFSSALPGGLLAPTTHAHALVCAALSRAAPSPLGSFLPPVWRPAFLSPRAPTWTCLPSYLAGLSVLRFIAPRPRQCERETIIRSLVPVFAQPPALPYRCIIFALENFTASSSKFMKIGSRRNPASVSLRHDSTSKGPGVALTPHSRSRSSPSGYRGPEDKWSKLSQWDTQRRLRAALDGGESQGCG